MNPIILYHCKQLDSDNRVVREFQVVASSIEDAKRAGIAVLETAKSPAKIWGIEVYPLHSIAAVSTDCTELVTYSASLPEWGAK